MTTIPDFPGSATDVLPVDHDEATLVGRVWRPDVAGPSTVVIRDRTAFDITGTFPTVRDLCEHPEPARAARHAAGEPVGTVDGLLDATPPERRADGQFGDRPRLLSPVDLQAVKASGVTFAVSLLERVIEERAHGDATLAAEARRAVVEAVGAELSSLRPGSAAAAAVEEVLRERGAWSQYLEVGLGPDAEIFTKAQPLSTVGTATDVGIHPDSRWNNPEPEAVLVLSSAGRAVGATLGNDVNLRDVEGRSALLLPKAKDNNASAALGPFIRLFDHAYTLDDLRTATVELTITGDDGFHLTGDSSMARISRDPEELSTQLMGTHHQYPDGAVLYLGTMFAPTQDRGTPGDGFTHHGGDLVRIANDRLGALVNRVRTSDRCTPWTFGIRDLMSNLAARGLL
ncbi:fumarylacetoacetate hydrolase family protein [Streptomyces sp. DW26H14]|uniref:fumarylacetoacetate hydrolase family protein n=1 Tax=Streptomyces sp. DW26H14 TaxID=3435395 RepID=UPI00403DFFC6